MIEATRTFTCFGGNTTVIVGGAGPLGEPGEAVTVARDLLLVWHAAFSRFKPESELSSLNRDEGTSVAVTAIMARFVQAVVDAAQATGGLVDATMLDAIEAIGYRTERFRGSLALPLALALAPPRRPAGAHPDRRWRTIDVDLDTSTVTRPPGVRLDGGGIVKGLLADVVGEMLQEHDSFLVDCEGDLRVGGSAGLLRCVAVAAPLSQRVLHEFDLTDGAVATTNITKRSWMERLKPAHHLLDPATGLPAYTGIVQATALAPTALEAEALAKAALLSGPQDAAGWLRHGGLIVFDDGCHAVVERRSPDRDH
ncbi:MAG: FAD:protein transferase [Solirubrobacteraceae bacterium]|jgi:thiamine biosynthesis lipoprotein|nr:FAD:protein transferase [Solirubrobacteraceae bacterium]